MMMAGGRVRQGHGLSFDALMLHLLMFSCPQFGRAEVPMNSEGSDETDWSSEGTLISD